MAINLPTLPERAGRRQALVGAALAMPGHHFAVIDGAQFPALQRDLTLARLDFRPLYLDEQDAPGMASGPHLAVLRNGVDVERVIDLVGAKPAVVFWSWPKDGGRPEEALYRHLRSIGLVEIPRGADDPDAARKAARHVNDDHDQPLSRWEAVVFRHADPNVLAVVLPALAGDYAGRFFGRAQQIAFLPSHHDAPVRLVAPAPTPEGRRPKLLRLDAAQYGMVAAGYLAGLRSRAITELAPQPGSDPKAAESRIGGAFDRSVGYGMRQKKEIWEFIKLDLAYGAGFERSPALRDIADDLGDPSLSGGTKLFRLSAELKFLARRAAG